MANSGTSLRNSHNSEKIKRSKLEHLHLLHFKGTVKEILLWMMKRQGLPLTIINWWWWVTSWELSSNFKDHHEPCRHAQHIKYTQVIIIYINNTSFNPSRKLSLPLICLEFDFSVEVKHDEGSISMTNKGLLHARCH